MYAWGLSRSAAVLANAEIYSPMASGLRLLTLNSTYSVSCGSLHKSRTRPSKPFLSLFGLEFIVVCYSLAKLAVPPVIRIFTMSGFT